MSAGSISHNITIKTPEHADRLLDALEKAEESYTGEYQPYYDSCTDCVKQLPVSCRYCKVKRLESENAALREKLEAAVKNICAYCTSEKWDHGCDPNCHRCEWKEMHNKVFGGQEGAKE